MAVFRSLSRVAARRIAIPLIAAALLLGTGCQMVGFVGQAFRGDEYVIEVEAEYRGLAGKSVAVLVSADPYTLYQHPQARLMITRAMSARMADNMPGVTVMDPAQAINFQDDNPYWQAVPYGELVGKLGVDAVVLVDVIEYQTHEPGNKHVWQGLVTANIGTLERDAMDPDDFTFYSTVQVLFPEDTKVGILNVDEPTIELGMVSIFSRDAAGLFYDHTVTQPTR